MKSSPPTTEDAPLLTHVGSGKYSDVFRVKHGRRRGGDVMMKVSYYRDTTLCNFLARAKAGDLPGAKRIKRMDSIEVSNAFARLTGKMVEAVSPHFVIVYCDTDCTNFAPRLKALLPERIKGLSVLQRKYNNLCFMEPYDSNLTQWLSRGRYTETSVRAVIFQVLYTLAALQKLLPGFRHNDLSTNNVLVKRLRAAGGMSATYTMPGGQMYRVSKLPILAALSDYDFLHVPGNSALSNERVVNGKYRVDGRRNTSYDTHFFLRSVQKCIVRRFAGTRAFAATKAFFKRLGLAEPDRQDVEIPGLDPASIIRDPYFDALATRTPPGAGSATYSY